MTDTMKSSSSHSTISSLHRSPSSEAQRTATSEDFYSPALNQAFKIITDYTKKLVAKFNELVAKVQKYHLLFAPVMGWIKKNLDTMRDLLGKLIDKVNYALKHWTPVLSLISASFAWIEKVKGPVSGLYSDVTSHTYDNTSNDDFGKWVGNAANRFNAKALVQQKAIGEAATSADLISAWLMKVAQSNVDFAVSLAEMVTKIYGMIANTAIDASSGLALPEAVDAASKAMVTLFDDGVKTLLQIYDRYVAGLGNVRDLKSRMIDQSVFDEGKWPEAVVG